MKLILQPDEIADLDRQESSTSGDGGFQSFLIQLQQRCDHSSGELDLSPSDLERIPRYAFDYGNGGWESRMKRIFERSLGAQLGR